MFYVAWCCIIFTSFLSAQATPKKAVNLVLEGQVKSKKWTSVHVQHFPIVSLEGKPLTTFIVVMRPREDMFTLITL